MSFYKMCSLVLLSHKEDIDNLLNPEGSGSGKKNILNKMEEINGSGLGEVSRKIDDAGASFVNLGTVIFVYAAVIFLAFASIGMIIHAGNPKNLMEEKDKVKLILLASVLGFSAVALVILAESIGIGLLGSPFFRG